MDLDLDMLSAAVAQMSWPVPLPPGTGDEVADLAAFTAWEQAVERHYYPARFGPDGARLPKRREFTFYVGAPEPSWLNRCDGVPKFISAARFDRYRSEEERWPVTTWDPYAIDSGAYIALDRDNLGVPWWQDRETYASKIFTYATNSGPVAPDFCAPQDWPCEPNVRRRTGMTVGEHQRLTLESYLFLTAEWPCLPWIPVLQGWEPDDYRVHERMYADAGVDLAACHRVGVGSICRRGHLPQIVEVIEQFADAGYQLHGFGIKKTALPVIGHLLRSADSMAWSFDARWSRPAPDAPRGIRLPGCTHTNCANCYRYATRWREQVLASLPATEEATVSTATQAHAAAAAPGSTIRCPVCQGRARIRKNGTIGRHFYGTLRTTCTMSEERPPADVKVLRRPGDEPEQGDLFAELAEFAALVAKDLGLTTPAPAGPRTIPLADVRWGAYGTVKGYWPTGGRCTETGYITLPPRVTTRGFASTSARGDGKRKGDELLSFVLDVPGAEPGHAGKSIGMFAETDAVFTVLDPPADRPLKATMRLSRRMPVADLRRGDVFYLWNEPGLSRADEEYYDRRPRYHVQADPKPAGDGRYELELLVDGRAVTRTLHGDEYTDVEDPTKVRWEDAATGYGTAVGQRRVADLTAPCVFRLDGQHAHLFEQPRPGLSDTVHLRIQVDGVVQTRVVDAGLLVDLVHADDWRWEPGHFMNTRDARVKVFTGDAPDRALPVVEVRPDGVLVRDGRGKTAPTRLVPYGEITGREQYGTRLTGPSPLHINAPGPYPGWPSSEPSAPLPADHPFTATFPGGRRCAVCLLSVNAECHPQDGPVNAGPVLDRLLAEVTRTGKTTIGARLARELADRYGAGVPLVRRERQLDAGLTFVCPVPGCGGMYVGWQTVRGIRQAWLEHAAGHDGFVGAWPDGAWPVEPEPQFVMPAPGKATPRRSVVRVVEPKGDLWWQALVEWFTAEGRVRRDGRAFDRGDVVTVVFDEGAAAARHLRDVLIEGGLPKSLIEVHTERAKPEGPLEGLPELVPPGPAEPAWSITFRGVPAGDPWWSVVIGMWRAAGVYREVREPDKDVALMASAKGMDDSACRAYLAAVCERAGVPVWPTSSHVWTFTPAAADGPVPLFDLDVLEAAVDAMLTT